MKDGMNWATDCVFDICPDEIANPKEVPNYA
jgi:hypothetical protein